MINLARYWNASEKKYKDAFRNIAILQVIVAPFIFDWSMVALIDVFRIYMIFFVGPITFIILLMGCLRLKVIEEQERDDE